MHFFGRLDSVAITNGTCHIYVMSQAYMLCPSDVTLKNQSHDCFLTNKQSNSRIFQNTTERTNNVAFIYQHDSIMYLYFLLNSPCVSYLQISIRACTRSPPSSIPLTHFSSSVPVCIFPSMVFI